MRGGLRNKYPNASGTSALLEAIWRRYGGPANVSRLTGISPQALVNWRYRGKVPLTKVNLVSKALGIPKWGLNYNELACMEDDIPSWKEVVESYDLVKSVVKYILSFKDEI